jgi:hypothetical protein
MNDAIKAMATEFDAAPPDADWEPPHPIFRLAEERDNLAAALNATRAELERLKAGIAGLPRYELRAHYWEDVADYIRADDLNALLTKEKI